jgi:hypothetical protein
VSGNVQVHFAAIAQYLISLFFSFGIMNKGDYERAISADPFMPRTRAKLAIPFVGKDVPSRSSEFAHPDVVSSHFIKFEC